MPPHNKNIIIAVNNRDFNINQNNRDYDICHNRPALIYIYIYIYIKYIYTHTHTHTHTHTRVYKDVQEGGEWGTNEHSFCIHFALLLYHTVMQLVVGSSELFKMSKCKKRCLNSSFCLYFSIGFTRPSFMKGKEIIPSYDFLRQQHSKAAQYPTACKFKWMT